MRGHVSNMWEAQGLPRLVEVVNNAPGARFNLAKTGELIWIR